MIGRDISVHLASVERVCTRAPTCVMNVSVVSRYCGRESLYVCVVVVLSSHDGLSVVGSTDVRAGIRVGSEKWRGRV